MILGHHNINHSLNQSIIHLCTLRLNVLLGLLLYFIDQQEILSQPFLYPMKQRKLQFLLQYNGFL